MFLTTTLAGCSPAVQSGGGKPKVICTVFPQYNMAEIIGGDKTDTVMLMKSGADIHNYEPTSADIISVSESDIFITVGGVNDIWLEKVLPSVSGGGRITVIKLMDCVETVKEEITEGMQEDRQDGHDGENAIQNGFDYDYDEHVWTSPRNMILIAENICGALTEKDRENEAYYAENLAALTAALEKLDADIREVTENAVRKTLIFGDRFAFRYFTEEYGLDYFAAFPGCSTDTDASAKTIAFLIDKVKSEKIPVVYYLENGTKKIAEAVCAETGAEAVLLNSCHTVDDSEDYIGLMYGNLENLKKGLY